MMSVSQLLTSARSTSILLETLEPPTMAQKGRLGALTAASRKLSSCARVAASAAREVHVSGLWSVSRIWLCSARAEAQRAGHGVGWCRRAAWAP